LPLMGSGASRKKRPIPADLDWWYSTPLEYGFQGPLLLRESSVRFPLQSLGDSKDVAAEEPQETGLPKDTDPDGETGAEESLLPAYSSYEFLCERMQQRMTNLQEALRQLEEEAEEAVEDTTRLPPKTAVAEEEFVEQRAAPFEREELEATEPRQDPNIDPHVDEVDAAVADGSSVAAETRLEAALEDSGSLLLFEPLSEFLRNQLHEKMAAMQQALEALATPRATPELQAERDSSCSDVKPSLEEAVPSKEAEEASDEKRDSSCSDAKPSLEEGPSEAVPSKEAEAFGERRPAVPDAEIFVEEPWLRLDCANSFLQQRLQEDLASLEDAVGRIGDFHEEPSRCTSPMEATFGALRARLQDNLREEEFTRFLDVLKGQVDRPEPCFTATQCSFPAWTSGPCQHPYEGMPLPELPILGSLRLREASQVPSQCRVPRAPRALQFTVPHMDFGRAADAVLEFSYAGVHRQEAVTKLLENRPLLLPLTDAKKSCRSLGRQGIHVSLLRLCETANFVLHPGCSVYTWSSGPTKIGFRLSGRETRSKDMMQWHMRYIAGLLEATLLERPKNPFSFMADLVACCQEVPKETGLEGARCFHLLWAEGLPPQALVSVRCGQKSRQASVEDLLAGRKRLEIGEGSLVQVQVLVRESMMGLPPPFVEEQLHQVQFPRVQSEMRPCGRCHRALPRPEEDLRLQIKVQYAESSTPRLCYYPGEGEAQKQYLVDHDLHDFGQELVRELVEASYAMPVDFLSFLGNKLSR